MVIAFDCNFCKEKGHFTVICLKIITKHCLLMKYAEIWISFNDKIAILMENAVSIEIILVLCAMNLAVKPISYFFYLHICHPKLFHSSILILQFKVGPGFFWLENCHNTHVERAWLKSNKNAKQQKKLLAHASKKLAKRKKKDILRRNMFLFNR